MAGMMYTPDPEFISSEDSDFDSYPLDVKTVRLCAMYRDIRRRCEYVLAMQRKCRKLEKFLQKWEKIKQKEERKEEEAVQKNAKLADHLETPQHLPESVETTENVRRKKFRKKGNTPRKDFCALNL